MVKSKIKKNPYAEFYLMQLEMIEHQRQYWLRHPKQFVKDLVRFAVFANDNLSLNDRIKVEKLLEKR